MRIARLQINWLDDKEKTVFSRFFANKNLFSIRVHISPSAECGDEKFSSSSFLFCTSKKLFSITNYYLSDIWVEREKGKKYVFQHNLKSFEVGEATLTGSMKMSVTFLFPLQSDSSIELLVQLVLRSLSLKADAISWSLLCNYTDWDAPTKPCY